MKIENISNLKINKLSDAQYKRELEAGNINKDELYLTPDENVEYHMHDIEEIYYLQEKLDKKADIKHVQTELDKKANKEHIHEIEDVNGLQTELDNIKKNNNNVGKNVTGTVYNIDDKEVTAGEGAEIFNNYNSNKASGIYSHAEGYLSTASGNGSHAEGSTTKASGSCSHAEGSTTKASGSYSHAEGFYTKAFGGCSHAEGHLTTASREQSHSEGFGTVASGVRSHAEGEETEASGQCSHAEGYHAKALGQGSHAEGGCYSPVNNDNSAITTKTINGVNYSISAPNAYGNNSHAEGSITFAYGNMSHAEGYSTLAQGNVSHAEGCGTTASGDYQHVQGKYNIEDTSNKYAHIIGNGENDNKRSNAHTVDWNGNAWFAGKIYLGGTSQENANELKNIEVDTQLSSTSTNPVQNKVIKEAIDNLTTKSVYLDVEEEPGVVKLALKATSEEPISVVPFKAGDGVDIGCQDSGEITISAKNTTYGLDVSSEGSNGVNLNLKPSEGDTVSIPIIGANGTTVNSTSDGGLLISCQDTVFSDSVPSVAGSGSAGISNAASRADHVHPAQTSVTGSSGSCTGNSTTATKLETARYINGIKFDGSKDIHNFGTCSTASSNNDKTVSCTGFKLYKGAQIVVNFTNASTVSTATLNVNSTGAKSIKYKNSTTLPFNLIHSDRLYTFVYDGTYWNIIGDYVHCGGKIANYSPDNSTSEPAPLAINQLNTNKPTTLRFEVNGTSWGVIGYDKNEGSLMRYSSTGLSKYRIHDEKTIQCGTVSFIPTAKDVSNYEIDFDYAFERVPSVIVTAASGTPYNSIQEVLVNNTTTTGFTLSVYRTTSSSTTFHWVAVVDKEA